MADIPASGEHSQQPAQVYARPIGPDPLLEPARSEHEHASPRLAARATRSVAGALAFAVGLIAAMLVTMEARAGATIGFPIWGAVEAIWGAEVLLTVAVIAECIRRNLPLLSWKQRPRWFHVPPGICGATFQVAAVYVPPLLGQGRSGFAPCWAAAGCCCSRSLGHVRIRRAAPYHRPPRHGAADRCWGFCAHCGRQIDSERLKRWQRGCSGGGCAPQRRSRHSAAGTGSPDPRCCEAAPLCTTDDLVVIFFSRAASPWR
jgi:uncharacterized membrane protein YdcZ (DUF606 family)